MSDPISTAIFAADAAINIYGAAEQDDMAQQAEAYKEEQIRNQQINLRLQDTQQAIARDQQLRKVIASTIVQSAVRNVSTESGSIRGILNQDFRNFDLDKEAANLNLQYKLTNLDIETAAAKMNENAQIDNAWLSAGKNIIGTGLSMYHDYQTGMKSSALNSTSNTSNLDLNKSFDEAEKNTYPDYPYVNKNPFDINAR